MLLNRLSALAFPVAGLIVLLVLWHLCVVLLDMPPVILPTPTNVAAVIWENWRTLLYQGWLTGLESIGGFLLAFALGVPMAVAVSSSQILHRMFYPLLIATQSVPKVALAPILLVWLGIGIESKLAIAWLVSFFPILVDTATGLRTTPSEYLDLARSVRASGWQTFYKIRLPAAVPFIMSGSKVAITLAVVGAVIGEFIGANAGLGNLLLVANSQINTPLAFAALVALAVLGLVLYGMVAVVDMALRPWLGEVGHG